MLAQSRSAHMPYVDNFRSIGAKLLTDMCPFLAPLRCRTCVDVRTEYGLIPTEECKFSSLPTYMKNFPEFSSISLRYLCRRTYVRSH